MSISSKNREAQGNKENVESTVQPPQPSQTEQVKIPETSAEFAPAPVVAPPSHFDPHFDNCYNNDIMALKAHSHAEDRVALVESTAKGWQDLGFYIKSAGDENEYLLFSTDPENVYNLRQFANSMRSNESVMTNFCMKGFKSVQFVTRDANMQQTLVTKFPTSVKASWQYIRRTAGATPVE